MTILSTKLLSMERVRLSFKEKRVLNDLSFEVHRGEIFGFLGPSGAGKTTTIKLLTQQLTKDSGTIELFCRPIENAHASDYERIGILSDTSSLYERMTIEDNLKFYAKIRGVSEAGIPELLERVGLEKDRKTLVKKCSKGMRQRATLLAALIHDPELLFLDEPTSGLDPAARREVHYMLEDLHKRKTTIFLTTHDMTEAEALCDRVGILNEGTLIACGDPESLKLQFAENKIRMLVDDAGPAGRRFIETTKDASGATIIAEALANGTCLTLHSEEPTLNDVFLRLTGKEFK